MSNGHLFLLSNVTYLRNAEKYVEKILCLVTLRTNRNARNHKTTYDNVNNYL